MILVTGYLPYRDEYNASGELISSLNCDLPAELSDLKDSLAFECIHVEEGTREVESQQVEKKLHSLLEKYNPACCIFTGQAPSCNRITIEKVGLNSFMGEIIDPDQTVAYWSNLPGTKTMQEALHAENIPAAYSYNAGQSLCNHILYSSLRTAHQSGRACKSGFIHIPLLPKQVVNKHRDRPFMTLDMTRRALTKVIRHTHDAG